MHIRAQTEKTTFTCKDDFLLTKRTRRWTYSALLYFSGKPYFSGPPYLFGCLPYFWGRLSFWGCLPFCRSLPFWSFLCFWGCLPFWCCFTFECCLHFRGLLNFQYCLKVCLHFRSWGLILKLSLLLTRGPPKNWKEFHKLPCMTLLGNIFLKSVHTDSLTCLALYIF